MGRAYLCGLFGMFALAGARPAALPAPEHAASPCASATVTKERLGDFLPGLYFRADSSALTFVPPSGRVSSLDRHARRITSPSSCRLAHRAYLEQIGGVENPGEAGPGTVAVVRIGSYYLIAEPDEYVIVLASRDWQPLGAIGLDND